MKEEYIVVDLETTGLDPYKGCEIIEIGVTEIIDGKIVRNYSRFVKPKGIIPSFITDITNIVTAKIINNVFLDDCSSFSISLFSFII